MEGYKQYLAYVLQGNKFESTGGAVSYRNSSSVVYSAKVQEALDNGEVPKGFEKFAETEQVVKLPKKAVGDYLKANEKNELEGAEVVVKKGMTIK